MGGGGSDRNASKKYGEKGNGIANVSESHQVLYSPTTTRVHNQHQELTTIVITSNPSKHRANNSHKTTANFADPKNYHQHHHNQQQVLRLLLSYRVPYTPTGRSHRQNGRFLRHARVPRQPRGAGARGSPGRAYRRLRLGQHHLTGQRLHRKGRYSWTKPELYRYRCRWRRGSKDGGG